MSAERLSPIMWSIPTTCLASREKYQVLLRPFDGRDASDPPINDRAQGRASHFHVDPRRYCNSPPALLGLIGGGTDMFARSGYRHAHLFASHYRVSPPSHRRIRLQDLATYDGVRSVELGSGSVGSRGLFRSPESQGDVARADSVSHPPRDEALLGVSAPMFSGGTISRGVLRLLPNLKTTILLRLRRRVLVFAWWLVLLPLWCSIVGFFLTPSFIAARCTISQVKPVSEVSLECWC